MVSDYKQTETNYKMLSARLIRNVLARRFLYVAIAIVLVLIFLHRNSRFDHLDRKFLLPSIDAVVRNGSSMGACKQSDLPVYAPEMMKYVKNVPPLDCSEAPKDWVVCEGFECRISQAIIDQKGRITCTFTDIIRHDDYRFTDGETTRSDSFYKLQKSDTVRVLCTSQHDQWKSVLTSVRFDEDIWARSGWEHVSEEGLPMNVLIFGFDSLSRNTVIRKLPKTYEYLTNELHTLLLKGYNIIGDGTPQALTPMLTGKTELELPETRKRMKDATFVNAYPFIWNNFSASGYVTGYFEDCPTIGTYTYRLKGFNTPPTDHYMRTYYMNILKVIPNWRPLCAGSIPRHNVMMNTVKSCTNRKFMFAFHVELSHGDYNQVGVADDDVYNFLKDLNDSGALNNTILIFMADHGHRFAEIRNTVQGKMEERLPFFSFTFPPWFQNKHRLMYDNFKNNLDTLVTPFDIYATLASVLNIGRLGKADLSERSLSLFSQIPKERSCAHAHIEPHWCACLEWNTIKLSEPIVQDLGDIFVKTLNDYTASHRDRCAVLKLSAVYWVSRLTPNENLLKYKKNSDYDGFVPDLTGKTDVKLDIYQMKVMLSPGDSLFEVTVMHHLQEDRMEVKMTDISRINKYGSQARCIQNEFHHLRKYCFCTRD